MAKTKPTYKTTKLGVLSVREIEAGITDNLVSVRVFILRNFKKLEIGCDLAKDLHSKLAGNLFEEAGEFRKRNVRVGAYNPPDFFAIPEMMKNWEDDFRERVKHAKSVDDKIELLSWMMHRFLLIHPFFDYNGRISRLLGEVYLLKNNLPAISFVGLKRKEFAEAMKKATFENDLGGIIKIVKRDL